MNAALRPKTPLRFAGPEGEARKQRSDGAHARAHLLHTALRLFSEKGFAKTSIRDIAQAAGANVAAISYYFGDKAGLYRAVFTEPLGSARDDIALYNQPGFTLRQSLEGFFSGFLEPLRQGELVQLSTRLHFREMLEPTGLWAEEIDQGIKP
ncbi:MAG: CerR family C-terminal domain-containing protein, partial [Polaromonas sp.]|nr:CerR family C-terminal domain-containing protein [Polaromonas sp.]